MNLYSKINENSNSIDQIQSSIEHLLPHREPLNEIENSIHLRILLCFMCGGETNDVEIFFSQLSSHFPLMLYNQVNFAMNAVLGRSNRKVRIKTDKRKPQNNYKLICFYFRLNSFQFRFILYLQSN